MLVPQLRFAAGLSYKVQEIDSYMPIVCQGRARPSLARLYNWRYQDLGDLPFVRTQPQFQLANAGFAYDFQFVDVPDYHGRGESEPVPYFYQVCFCLGLLLPISSLPRPPFCTCEANL